MGIIAWIVFGLIAGWLAKLLMPGKEAEPKGEVKQPSGKTMVDWTVAGGGRGARAPSTIDGLSIW